MSQVPNVRRAARVMAVGCEPLEPRIVLSALPLLAEGGTIATPHSSATVAMLLTTDRFTPPPSGKTLFNIEVRPAAGSPFDSGRFE